MTVIFGKELMVRRKAMQESEFTLRDAAAINEAYMQAVNYWNANAGIQFDEYPFEPSQMHIGYDFANIPELNVPEPTPEPQPSLPAEVHHTVAFNESAAWEAVVALSRGC